MLQAMLEVEAPPHLGCLAPDLHLRPKTVVQFRQGSLFLALPLVRLIDA